MCTSCSASHMAVACEDSISGNQGTTNYLHHTRGWHHPMTTIINTGFHILNTKTSKYPLCNLIQMNFIAILQWYGWWQRAHCYTSKVYHRCSQVPAQECVWCISMTCHLSSLQKRSLECHRSCHHANDSFYDILEMFPQMFPQVCLCTQNWRNIFPGTTSQSQQTDEMAKLNLFSEDI